MSRFLLVLVLAFASGPLIVAEAPQQETRADLTWAFPVADQNLPGNFEQSILEHVPGSDQTYPEPEIDPFSPPDWFPGEHLPMPPVVRHGAGKSVQACSYCHLASGLGHPQSANLTGLSVAYLMRQLADFKSGARDAPPMTAFAQALSEEDAREASEWFATLKPSAWIKVVETDTAPKTFVVQTRLRLPLPDGGTEPLGNRIIEVPENPARAESYDPHSGFIAYVPVGSLAKGKELVNTGGAGKTVACAACHGETLRGGGDAPRIAGRSPIYIFRQLYSIQTGTRAGAAAESMKLVIAKLSPDDMLAIAAYVASCVP